ncbi:MAG: metallopeptidase family protein [Longimicrobiales bacterium]
MRFDEFEKLAWEYWEKVPAEYRQGVDGLTIERDARAHPDLSEIYTLGECLTESFPSDFGGPDTTRSAVVLYYGSFLRLAHQDPSFDWEKELWETLTHELQHHLEALAVEDALEDFDYAVDENFKRQNGDSFDPLFYRVGESLGQGRYRVEDDTFIEITSAPGERGDSWIDFDWEGAHYRVARPLQPADVAFVRVNSGPVLEHGEILLVLLRRRGFLRQMRDAFANRPLDVSETEAVAEPL